MIAEAVQIAAAIGMGILNRRRAKKQRRLMEEAQREEMERNSEPYSDKGDYSNSFFDNQTGKHYIMGGVGGNSTAWSLQQREKDLKNKWAKDALMREKFGKEKEKYVNMWNLAHKPTSVFHRDPHNRNSKGIGESEGFTRQDRKLAKAKLWEINNPLAIKKGWKVTEDGRIVNPLGVTVKGGADYKKNHFEMDSMNPNIGKLGSLYTKGEVKGDLSDPDLRKMNHGGTFFNTDTYTFQDFDPYDSSTNQEKMINLAKKDKSLGMGYDAETIKNYKPRFELENVRRGKSTRMKNFYDPSSYEKSETKDTLHMTPEEKRSHMIYMLENEGGKLSATETKSVNDQFKRDNADWERKQRESNKYANSPKNVGVNERFKFDKKSKLSQIAQMNLEKERRKKLRGN